MLDLSFLPNDLSVFDLSVKEDPDGYIHVLKTSFSDAVDIYNQDNYIPIEMDISFLLEKLPLSKKVAQLFIFGVQ
jgi:hypothetical protein